MCGIAGIISFDGGLLDGARLTDVCATMRHRGPDDAGTFLDHHERLSIGLASVRLAVMDPTPAGHQPFLYDEDRYLLAYNGEIYNFGALRTELAAEGWRFRTDTDTEVVAASCACWGPAALTRFNGMWSFVFFDRTTRSGFCARDRFGIKPLLFARSAGRLLFASEMGALRRLGDWDRSLDRRALLHYLRFGYFAAPRTVYESAFRLAPGEYLAFDARGVRDPLRYEQPASAPALPDYGDACRRVREALFRAVAHRRVADVPLGAFLSGGLDSAIIAHHLAECTPGRITTFSIGYTGHRTYDETSFARLVADHVDSEHHELRLSHRDVLDVLEPLLDHLGEPFFDSSLLPTAIVSRLARKHVTVCLSGDGGDELFGGYWRYLGHDTIDGYLRLPARVRRRLIEPWLKRAPVSKSSRGANRVRQFHKLLRAVETHRQGPPGADAPARRHLAWSQILAPQAERILREPYRNDQTCADVLEHMDSLVPHGPAGDALNRILAFDLRYSLPGDMLHKVDLAGMYHSLEVRVPFLDPAVVAVAEGCPSTFKVARGVRKKLLVDAYRGRLPDAVLDRPKMGFEVPIGEFLRRELRELYLSTVTRECIESLDVLDYAQVKKVYEDHCARRSEHADLLFALLSLCWWCRGGG